MITDVPQDHRAVAKALRAAQPEGHAFCEAVSAENYKTGHRAADNVAALTRVASTAYGALAGTIHSVTSFAAVALVGYASTKVASLRDLFVRSIGVKARRWSPWQDLIDVRGGSG